MAALGDIDVTVTAPGGPGTALVLSVEGEVDLVTADRLRAALSAALGGVPPGLVVDLSGVPFLDSTGLAALAAATRRAGEHGVPLALCGVQPVVHRVLDVTGLAAVWPLHPDAAAALAALAAGTGALPDPGATPGDAGPG